jgi:hypothetical protein
MIYKLGARRQLIKEESSNQMIEKFCLSRQQLELFGSSRAYDLVGSPLAQTAPHRPRRIMIQTHPLTLSIGQYPTQKPNI